MKNKFKTVLFGSVLSFVGLGSDLHSDLNSDLGQSVVLDYVKSSYVFNEEAESQKFEVVKGQIQEKMADWADFLKVDINAAKMDPKLYVAMHEAGHAIVSLKTASVFLTGAVNLEMKGGYCTTFRGNNYNSFEYLCISLAGEPKNSFCIHTPAKETHKCSNEL